MKRLLFTFVFALSLPLFASEPVVTCVHKDGDNEMGLVSMFISETDFADPYTNHLEIELKFLDGTIDLFKGKIHRDDLTTAKESEQIIMTSTYLAETTNPANQALFVSFTIMDGRAGIAIQREVGDLLLVTEGMNCTWSK